MEVGTRVRYTLADPQDTPGLTTECIAKIVAPNIYGENSERYIVDRIVFPVNGREMLVYRRYLEKVD